MIGRELRQEPMAFGGQNNCRAIQAGGPGAQQAIQFRDVRIRAARRQQRRGFYLAAADSQRVSRPAVLSTSVYVTASVEERGGDLCATAAPDGPVQGCLAERRRFTPSASS